MQYVLHIAELIGRLSGTLLIQSCSVNMCGQSIRIHLVHMYLYSGAGQVIEESVWGELPIFSDNTELLQENPLQNFCQYMTIGSQGISFYMAKLQNVDMLIPSQELETMTLLIHDDLHVAHMHSCQLLLSLFTIQIQAKNHDQLCNYEPVTAN